MRSLLLSDLSCSPNPALILISACTRGVRACACSYMSRRDSEKIWQLILNDVQKFKLEEDIKKMSNIYLCIFHLLFLKVKIRV